ncbi:ribosome hibernation-promoting factor, HPF/YfiA family [Flavihumibacter profundi]|uniref:ribosome hibernation-promoting factor, HPF/YfiA family n=1 Tax=Flavihumibacter profundi TaxID=2716883 RepID=UPI001CC5EA48|nr:ribosome-associated translation inhibitor RaiA [Flavihumibacter profundi]MBZ5859010.1 ribosome-associated translation inhibitor RaiA [Flavihumibacter profundi]
MQLQIESPHIEPDDKLMELVSEKFEHLGKRYDRIGTCTVVLRKEKSDVRKYYSIEAKMEVPKSKILFASDRAESFEIALEKVVDDLEHQLRKFKEELEENR